MDKVDVADHLCDHFRFDKWMRKTKWWWSLFLWFYEMLLVNSCLFYRGMCREAGVKPMSHYQYQQQVALAMLDPTSYWPSKSPLSHSGASTSGHSSVETRASSAAAGPVRAGHLADKHLKQGAPFDNLRRSVGLGCHIAEPPKSTKATCALHNYLTSEKHRSQILRCPTCNMHLCSSCFRPHHNCDNVLDSKDEIKSNMPSRTRQQ